MSLWLLRFWSFFSWSAPKAMEHGLMQPDPIESRPKDEKRKASWVRVAGLQPLSISWQDEGVNCGIMEVNHRKVIPCSNNMIIQAFIQQEHIINDSDNEIITFVSVFYKI